MILYAAEVAIEVAPASQVVVIGFLVVCASQGDRLSLRLEQDDIHPGSNPGRDLCLYAKDISRDQ